VTEHTSISSHPATDLWGKPTEEILTEYAKNPFLRSKLSCLLKGQASDKVPSTSSKKMIDSEGHISTLKQQMNSGESLREQKLREIS
jgi:hypothetical protein